MMGFDQIDRQFAAKQPIKLECVNCASTAGIALRTPVNLPLLHDQGDMPLCVACAYGRHEGEG